MTDAQRMSSKMEVARNVLEQAVKRALESKGLSGTPLEEAAFRVLELEMTYIDDRGDAANRVIHFVKQWSKQNADDINALEKYS